VPAGRGNFAAISAGLKPARSVIASWHPVPDVLGANKEKAEIFRIQWNRWVSRGDMVYLRREQGEKIIEQYGMSNGLGIKKQVANFWR
jgi:Holliday junction resolvase